MDLNGLNDFSLNQNRIVYMVNLDGFFKEPETTGFIE